jgi:5'(3')-deoxyribonucleotidase
MRILLDLDEVLADFVGGACKAWGCTKEQVEEHWELGQWDIRYPLSKALGRTEVMSSELFWTRINNSEAFWVGLKPTPWMEELWAFCQCLSDDIHIVSAPSRCESSYFGKVKWLRNQFGQNFSNFALTPYKHIFAGPDVILIDDRDENVEAFRKAGGHGLVFPRIHNSLYVFKDDPLGLIRFCLTTSKEQTNGIPLPQCQ